MAGISRRKFLTFMGVAFFSACSKTLIRKDGAHQPLLRVGLLQHKNVAYFMVGGPFSIFQGDGKFVARSLKGYNWRVNIAEITPAQIEYRLRYWMTADRRLAFEKSHELAQKDLRPEILEFKSTGMRWGIANVGQTIYHVVLWQIFKSKQAAEEMQQKLASDIRLELMEVTKKPAGGTIEITNIETGRYFRFPSGSRIVVDRFALLEVPVGEGFHWQTTRDRVYRGNFELLIDKKQKLTVVNILPLEDYLQGVVPSEMHPNFPIDALKAQAIAARSQVLARAGQRHQDDGFDVCATVHCQVYSGMMREAESTNKAVKETTGLVLLSKGNIIDAVYSGVCGGNTENNENVWQGKPQSYLRGIFDGKGKPDFLDGFLKDPAKLRRWIEQRPPVFCNTVDSPIPDALQYTQKYFRWQQTETRLALSGFIRKETGENFGQLKDIVPLERGVSGRLRRIRIVGTLKSFDIDKELKIRKALSRSVLYSSCFIIEKEIGSGGLPETFTFQGAGWGHGVGMCQTGAAMMALQGYHFARILKHYYLNVRIGAAY